MGDPKGHQPPAVGERTRRLLRLGINPEELQSAGGSVLESLFTLARDGDGNAEPLLWEEALIIAEVAAERRVHNREDARDLAAQAISDAYAKRDCIRKGRFTAFLRSILAYDCIDLVRRRARSRSSSLEELTERGALEGFAGLSDRDPTPEEAVLRMAPLDPKLEKAVGQLPPREREAVTLVYLDGLSPEEVAGRLGIKRNALDAALSRGRRRLRLIVSEDQGE